MDSSTWMRKLIKEGERESPYLTEEDYRLLAKIKRYEAQVYLELGFIEYSDLAQKVASIAQERAEEMKQK